jgi:hypothetical protein
MMDEVVTRHDPQATGTWGLAWNEIKEKVRDMSLLKSNALRYAASTKLIKDKANLLRLKQNIDTATATPHETTAYIKLGASIAEETKKDRSAMQSNEEIAYNLGKQHEIGSAAFYRSYTPQGATHWIENKFDADWSDPSNPTRTNTFTTIAANIAAAVTPYYTALFARKVIDPVGAEKCWKTLRTGKGVYPPHRRQMLRATDRRRGEPNLQHPPHRQITRTR